MTQHLPRRFAVAAIALLATAPLAACGGDGHDSGVPGAAHTGQLATSASVNAAFAADIAFAAAMIPHHQQALEMALLAEGRAGSAPVKELAGRIRKAQDPEIATMSDWLRQWGQVVPTTAPGAGHGHHAGMPGMMTDQELKDLTAATGARFDRMFLEMMIRHHQGAIDMANIELRQGQFAPARQLAQKIATDQAAEINQMRQLLTAL